MVIILYHERRVKLDSLPVLTCFPCVLTGWQGLWHWYTGVWEAARFLLVAWQDCILVDERPESSC